MNKEKIILDKITKWLKEEVTDNQDIVDAYDNGDNAITTSGDYSLYYGRYECSKGLLNQIDKCGQE